MRSTHSAIARHARIANSQLLLRRIHLPSTSISATGTVSARQPRKPGNGRVNPRRPLASEDKDAESSRSASAAEDAEHEKGQVRQMTFTSIEELQRFLAEGGEKPPPAASAPSGTDGEPSVPPEATEPTEKPKRRTRTSSKDKDSSPTPPTLPVDLDVLWSPAIDSSLASSSAIPPDQILNDALTSLRIALQPQTQHHAAYPSSSPNPPSIEPSIALYCPIEGGGYVIDEAVRELARRTGADVLVLDAVQLAAGEWGMFGTSATAIQLPQNPLHFASASPVPSRPSNNREEEEENVEEDEDDPSSAIQSSILHFLTPSAPSAPSRPGRSFFSSSRNSSSASSPSARTKAFFDELLALPRLGSSGSDDNSPTDAAPRIVYIRDTPTLAASSSAWYPHLLAALRTRRQGSLASKSSASSTATISSAVSNPTVLVLGMTPPLTGGQSASPSRLSSQALSPSSSSSNDTSDSTPSFSDFVRDFRENSSPGRSFSISRGDETSSGKTDEAAKRNGDKWGEDDYADKQRASRLRERLRRWEMGMVPPLPVLESGNVSGSEGESSPFAPFGGGGPGRSGVVVLGGGPISGMLGGGMRMQMRLAGGDGSGSSISGTGEDSSTGYWRHATLVPSSRDLEKEREERIARRREINALTIRMAVGALGGVLPTSGECEDEWKGVAERMWEDWGRRIEAWATVRKVADGALGRGLELASQGATEVGETTATPVSWENVFAAWADLGSGLEARKAWMKGEASMLGTGSSGKGSRGEAEDTEGEGSALGSETDELVERLKRDPDLDQHEQRLLGCIVDSASMPTSFAQVHLPAHTIDSVRTVVSLPLLYPEAFQTGVLKEHGMSGVLLFGPPGTGKTLLARALAKEAGCRMMSIAPSDVMDMYVGEGEKLVRAVFALARKLSPCVLFVDELDALFGARASGRDGGSGGGGAAAHRGVLTEFMQEMDGLRTPSSGGGGKGNERVIVVGATNRPFDLDDAVLRRLPRRLLVDLPGKEEREAILKILLRDEQLDEDVDLREIASQTESFSGSDLKHLCVSAALDAVKEQVTVPWAVAASPPSAIHAHAGTGGPAVEQAVQPVTNTLATPKAQILKMLTPDSGIAASKQCSDVHMEKPAAKELSSASEEVGDNDTVREVLSSSSTEDLVSTVSTPPTEPKPEIEAEQKTPKSSPSRRVLRAHNFTKALREITPSASEALGTLADLRKWNNEFGEGRRDKKRVQVWGRGTFGFTIPGTPADAKKGSDKLPPLKDDNGVD